MTAIILMIPTNAIMREVHSMGAILIYLRKEVKINKPMPALKKYVPHNEFAFFQFSLLFMDKEVRIPE